MSDKKVRIKSKTGQVQIERKKPPAFSYTFDSEDSVVEVPAEHAKYILENRMFYEADSTEKPTKTKKLAEPKKRESSFEGPPKEDEK